MELCSDFGSQEKLVAGNILEGLPFCRSPVRSDFFSAGIFSEGVLYLQETFLKECVLKEIDSAVIFLK